MARKLENNTELVEDLMTFSPYGALSQAFVTEAIRRYAKEVMEYEVTEADDRSFIDMNTWKKVAEDINNRMDEFYKR